jgi:hypothetical protein
MRQCITHHHACDCRERKFEEHQRSLREIQAFAIFCMRHYGQLKVVPEILKVIKDKCDEVLEEKK